MQRYTVFAIITALIVGAGVSVYLLSQRRNVSEQSNTRNLVPSEKTRQYTDESGFAFSYPENLTLEKNDINDVSVYANIILTSPGLGGSVSVKVADTPFSSLESWTKSREGASAQKGAKIGELEAYEIITDAKRATAAIDQGILFLVETAFEGKEPFWSRVHSDVVSSFMFSATQESAGGSTSSDEEVIVEEEIIE